ncbi:MAG: sigma-70 family RNA polymerase sigma factor [SAR202 cluster bacterium]|nr:sigma-70 family RNA polymerase sigma factor [SAR202 cluster bacterium]|tara:strand:- start:4215 stop:4751 length:537 start_codon:yes stop_codon:yes gene_type:complete
MANNFTENDIANLFENNYEKVVNYIAVRISNFSEAEELASDVFIKALEHIDGFKNKGIPLEVWIYKIAHNITIDYYRKKKYPTINIEDVINMESFNNTEKKVLENLDKEEIKLALTKLSTLQQQVIQLRLVSGLRSKEVAQIMEKSDGAIRELQRSGLKALREILQTNNLYITEDLGR